MDQVTEPYFSIDNYPKSAIPLYVQISESLKSRYYTRLRCHLKTAYKESDNTTIAYKETDIILTDIELNEAKHNEAVVDFINGINQKIRNAIYAVEDCSIKNITEHKFASSITPTFVTNHIYDYYIAKSDSAVNEELRIRRLNSDYQLFRTSDMLEEMGRGDEESMICLKKKLEKLEIEVVKELKNLRHEANRLTLQFNVHLKSKLTDLIVQIEEDGRLHGKCEFESNL